MQSHAGLFNLCIVVLVAVNSRLIIENLMKVCVPPSLGNFSCDHRLLAHDRAPISYFYLLIL
jgi:hypothetical protein